MSIGRFTSYNLIGELIPQIVTLITIPIYLHLIGPERFGVLSLSWLLLGYFGLFDLGLGRATSFRIAAQRDAPAADRAETFWGALIVNIGMGVIGGLILWAAGAFFFAKMFKVQESLRPEILQAMPLLALSVPVATLTGVLTGALQGREKFLETNKISVLFTTLFQVLPILIAWFHGPQLIWLLAAALASRAVALVLLWMLCNRDILSGHPIKTGWATIKVLLGYGSWVSFNALIGPVLVIVDRFAIGAVLGATAVAYYTVPFQIAKRITILPGALSNALFPKLAIASPAEAIELGQKSLATVVSAITPPVLIAVLFIEPFLRLWVGHNVASLAAATGRVLLIGYWLNALALLPFIRLQASGRPNIVTYILLMQIPFYLAALYFGMVNFGLVGCALALAARFGVDLMMQQRGANGRLEGLSITLVPLGLLCAASLVFTVWTYSDIAGWACATGLIILSFAHAWRTAPLELRNLIFGVAERLNIRIGRIWGRAR